MKKKIKLSKSPVFKKKSIIIKNKSFEFKKINKFENFKIYNLNCIKFDENLEINQYIKEVFNNLKIIKKECENNFDKKIIDFLFKSKYYQMEFFLLHEKIIIELEKRNVKIIPNKTLNLFINFYRKNLKNINNSIENNKNIKTLKSELIFWFDNLNFKLKNSLK